MNNRSSQIVRFKSWLSDLKERFREDLPEIIIGIIFISLIYGLGHLLATRKNSVEKRYGFCTMTPDLRWIPCHIEPLMIRCVEKRGAFDKAGFKDRDILILPDIHSVNAFHKLLKKPKGTVIEFKVIPWARFKPSCETDDWEKQEERIVVAP